MKSSLLKQLAEEAKQPVTNQTVTKTEKKIVSVDKIEEPAILPESTIEISDNESDFDRFIAEAKEKVYTQSQSYVYIDKDLKEIFSLIKSKLNVDMFSLISYILENWIEQHSNEIKEKLSKNKFL